MEHAVIEHFTFESREDYDRAEKEMEFINQIQEKVDLTVGENALKVYNKAVSDKMFETVIGYLFLDELRQVIIAGEVASADSLADIPVKFSQNSGTDVIQKRPSSESRVQRMYEGQRLLNHKLKIAIVALVVLLAGFVIINFRFEYSIFTYFTNYKANMEEELIDKYENWQSELEEREQKLTGEDKTDEPAETELPETTPSA